ncbi:MAG: 23S rRNA (uracil(1939)-C(5))-methyltransferase RlmD [Bacteroidales bacterium]|nr:23S rRNA (uracil(1939)-C(5))-methyltransferase RlmD [Bacteroidales bacterium]
MGRKMKFFPILENLEVVDAGVEGNAVAKHGEKVVFVPFVVPGDVIDVKITDKKKSFLHGRAIAIKKFSPLRIDPVCEHFTVCGGCKWQNMHYSDQLKFKHKQVEDALTRIGKIDISGINEILENETAYNYRNKLEFTFSNFRWLEDFQRGESIENRNMNGLGFHKPGLFDRVVDINSCHLMDNAANQIRNQIRDYAQLHKLSFFDIKRRDGFLRNLIIRNTLDGDLMVILVFFKEMEAERVDLLNFVKNTFPQITSLIYIINSKPNDSIADQEFEIYHGKPYITETMTTPDGKQVTFQIGPKSFYQTNSKQANRLYNMVMNYANLQGSEILYDLYTGTGTIANFLAHRAGKVIGIEYIGEAIEDAKTNSQINGIENSDFVAGDMVKVLNDEFVATHGKPDVIITDPPRAGMHADVVKMILKLEPKRIVYVSCNPATQARDLAMLTEKYSIKKLQPVDMFPQTAHVENIALLELTSSILMD